MFLETTERDGGEELKHKGKRAAHTLFTKLHMGIKGILSQTPGKAMSSLNIINSYLNLLSFLHFRLKYNCRPTIQLKNE